MERILRMMRIASCFLAVVFPISALAQDAAPAATRTAVTTTVSPEIKEFQKIEDSWAAAVNGRDQYAMELVLSPLFVDVAANGDITTRNQQVAALIADPDKTMHLDQTVITVRMLGDVAVTNGTYVLHRKAATGPMDEKGVFTHVFQRVRGNWLCINSQRTTLREEMEGKSKKQASKQGGKTADQPFHIPLFMKDKSND
jgi:ketosteroid isomerase-like protein